jgi:hypothetical protein
VPLRTSQWLTNKGLVTEFEERELGTNPWFKKPRVIGEKVVKAQGKIEVCRREKI